MAVEADEFGRFCHQYIGDGAYAYVDPGRSIVLYTSDGYSETNRVVIDVGDVRTLMDWLVLRVRFLKEADGRG